MDILRGDIWYIRPFKGMDKYRPYIIVSNDGINRTADHVLAVPLTTKVKKPLPSHCQVIAREVSTALCEDVEWVDKSRLRNYVKTITGKELENVEKCLRAALDMKPGDKDLTELASYYERGWKEATAKIKELEESCTMLCKEREEFSRKHIEAMDENIKLRKELNFLKEKYLFVLDTFIEFIME